MHQRRAEGSDPFLWAEGVPGVKMHRMMSVQYGNRALSQRIDSEWIERFKNGRTSVKRGEGTGRQSTSITDADMERVYCLSCWKQRVGSQADPDIFSPQRITFQTNVTELN